MSADLAAALDGLTGTRVAEVPVSEHAVRTWCAAIGETDPRYLGPDPVAPPAMLQTWTMPIATRAQPTLHARARAAAREAGLSAVVATDYEQEYLRPIRPGMLLRERSWIEAVSPPKDTALGRGRFVTIGFEMGDETGLVGRMRARTLYFDPAPVRRAPAGPPEPAPGDPLVVPMTRTLIVAAALASNDHEPVHHDHEVARAQGLADIIASIVTTAGLVHRCAGALVPDGHCTALRLRLALPCFPGDELALRGKVRPVGTGCGVTVTGDHARGRHVAAEVTYDRGL
ncbi:MaoC/PaaZ C-terminal domain-containing protein [Pseudonocardia sp. NPDC049154]|uniref:MaoC/PaaZ C-terminal domain-containing protein n=1 Tax=Pseudonocardia sp. NPDC049154 TaxID=3155501 RepID=UPI0033E8CDF1